MRFIHVAVMAFLGLQSVAHAAVPSHQYSAEESQYIVAHNKSVAEKEKFFEGLFSSIQPLVNAAQAEPVRMPWAEYGEAGYLIFSDDTDLLAGDAKKAMAQRLPKDMTLVVYTGNKSLQYQKELFKEYAQYIDADRLKVIYLSTGNRGFWARDGVPVPTWSLVNGARKFGVVDAKYYHKFENDYEFSQYFNADLININPYMHEGGNFLANEDGECVVVNNERTVQIPDLSFKTKYGCHKLLRLPFIKGIGHVDESVKFIDKDTVISDDPTYQKMLKEAGYEVIKMPRPENEYETYINSLVVNGTVFLPVFGQAGDQEAIAIYESFGLKVVPVDSTQLSNDGLGSIHCITMVYPKVSFNELMDAITASDF